MRAVCYNKEDPEPIKKEAGAGLFFLKALTSKQRLLTA
jgi:hypothetical protein